MNNPTNANSGHASVIRIPGKRKNGNSVINYSSWEWFIHNGDLKSYPNTKRNTGFGYLYAISTFETDTTQGRFGCYPNLPSARTELEFMPDVPVGIVSKVN